MSVRKDIQEKSGIYFITLTCRGWHNLFSITDGYTAVYRWFDYLKSQGHFILGYVIMPNHLHALIAFCSSEKKSINTIVGNGKRFMAYDLIKRLEEKGENNLLLELSSYVNKTDRKRGKLHDVFEPSFDWKECYSDTFIEQKLNYIHENPCRGKWTLAKQPWDYRHSSARFYAFGEQGIYDVTSYGEMKDNDLTGSFAESPCANFRVRNAAKN
jgi:REP element-mobilizing transposase RayT